MNKTELKNKMDRLYALKLKIQSLETEKEAKSKKWIELGSKVRSIAQDIAKHKKVLFEEI